MLDTSSHIKNLVALGDFFRNINLLNKKYQSLKQCIEQTEIQNPWFTKENILYSMKVWGETLTNEKIKEWVSSYNLSNQKSKKIGIIIPSNIPLVGLHDLLCVLITNHKAILKTSKEDSYLTAFIVKILCNIDKRYTQQIDIEKENFRDIDCVIATGSDNTGRYFDYYFGKYPNIIRKNRTSIAILNGKESKEELQNLCEDITRYFGLGCRNVSKLFVPKGYDFNLIFNELYLYKEISAHNKFRNNYEYNRTIYLLNKEKFLDNGFMLLKKENTLFPPIATLFYEEYETLEILQKQIQEQKNNIQCVVSKQENHIPFGKTQHPELADYADTIDTLKFLIFAP